MASLPIFTSDNRILSQLQTQWASILNVLLGNPSLQNVLLKDVRLVSGANVINHRLGRTPQGWRIADIGGAITIYRSAAFNDKTLTLTASGGVTVTLEVF